MKKPKSPCVADCPDRSAECHATCDKNLKYEREYRDYIIDLHMKRLEESNPLRREWTAAQRRRWK